MELKMFLSRVILWIFLLSPLTTFAMEHLIAISPITPFPEKVAVSATKIAEFRITNLSSISLKIVDKSEFPPNSGLTISYNGCSQWLNPKDYCDIKLQLTASATPQTISTQLTETTAPTPDLSDTISYPIKIEITQAYTI